MPWWMWMLSGFWLGYVLAAVLMHIDMRRGVLPSGKELQ